MKDFNSSDEDRTYQYSKYLKEFKLPSRLNLERGGFLDDVVVAYETYGKLDSKKSNCIMICHAITGDSHVAKHNSDDLPGWWDIMVGPGKYIDTDKYFVICSNILGSCRGTTGPNSINKKTGNYYGPDFPLITVGDMVNVQKNLIDHLKIDKLLGVVGGSLGGFQCLEWATRYPNKIIGFVHIPSSPRLTTQG